MVTQSHPREWPWPAWCAEHGAATTTQVQVMPCLTHSHACHLTTVCHIQKLSHHQGLPVLLFQGVRGYAARITLFQAEDVEMQHHLSKYTASLHRWITIYVELVAMCSTKSFTTIKTYLLFMRDLSIIYQCSQNTKLKDIVTSGLVSQK